MNTILSNNSLLKKPGAFIPLLMSLVAVTMVLVNFVLVGIVHEADESTLAHIFQILIVTQIPLAIYFFLNQIDKKPKQVLQILGLQIVVWLLAITSVYFLT